MNGGVESELAVIRSIGLKLKTFNIMSPMLCGEKHPWNIGRQIYGTKTLVVKSVEKGILKKINGCFE